MPLGILLGQFGAEVARGRVDVDLALAQAALELGVAGFDVVRRVAGHNNHKVASAAPASSRTFAAASGNPLASRLKSSMNLAPFFRSKSG